MPDDKDDAKEGEPQAGNVGLVAKLNAIKGFLTAVAALIVAVGAMLKPADTKTTKATYDATSGAIQQLAGDLQRIHDDQVALRAYLEGRFQAEQGATPALPTVASQGLGVTTGAGGGAAFAPRDAGRGPVVVIPGVGAAVSAPTGASATPPSASAGSAPRPASIAPPPPLSPKPASPTLPPFNSL